MSVGTVLSGVFYLLKRIGPPAALLLVVLDLPIAAIDVWLHPPTVVSSIYGLLVSIVAQSAVLVMAHGVVTGESPTSVLPALGAAVRRWPALVGTQILVNIVTIIGLLACLVPGIIAALGFTAVLPLVLHENESGANALKTSWSHMTGHKGTAFVAYLAAAVPLLLATGVFVVVVAVTLLGSLDPMAADPPELSAGYRITEAAFTVLMPAFLTPVVLVPAVVYAKLRTAADARTLGTHMFR